MTTPTKLLLARFVRILEWRRFGQWLPLLVLATSLVITHLLWKNQYQESSRELQTEFDSHVREAMRHIEDRMKVYEQMLRGIMVLFNTFGNIGRDDFHTYIIKLQLEKNYPGVQAVGFVPIVPRAEKDKHIAAMRKEGFPAYTIQSEGKQDTYAPTFYIEPFSGSNLGALGYDMFAEPVNRIAMEQARDTGNPVNTGKVLLRETDDHLRAGFLTFVPVYKNGEPHDTIAERRANIIGWAYLSFHMESLMANILGEASTMIDIELLDGKTLFDESLMYDSDPSASHLSGSSSARFRAAKQIGIANHTWTLAAHSLPTFDRQLEGGKPQFFAYAGTGTSLLWALLTWLLVFGRKRALQEVQEIRKSESCYQQMFEENASIAFLLDPDTGHIVDANAAAIAFWGYSLEELRGMNIAKISIVPSGKIVEVMNTIRNGLTHRIELYHRLKSGEIRDVEVFSGPLDYQGKTLRYSIAHDITARKRAEEGLRLALTVFHTVKDAVVVTDPDNLIIMVNPAFTAITGYSADEVIGKNPRILSSKTHPPVFYVKVWETLLATGSWSGEICNRRKSGELYTEWLSIKLVRDESGKITHHVAVFHEILQRKATEERK